MLNYSTQNIAIFYWSRLSLSQILGHDIIIHYKATANVHADLFSHAPAGSMVGMNGFDVVFVDVEHEPGGVLPHGNALNLLKSLCADAAAVILGQQVKLVQFHDAFTIWTHGKKSYHIDAVDNLHPDDALVFHFVQNNLFCIATIQHVVNLFHGDDAGVVGMPDTVCKQYEI